VGAWSKADRLHFIVQGSLLSAIGSHFSRYFFRGELDPDLSAERVMAEHIDLLRCPGLKVKVKYARSHVDRFTIQRIFLSLLEKLLLPGLDNSLINGYY
ncbi:MAG: hypothetical protein RDV48_30650, partial [Candidatus Eremiobacteraeota bacterium]|nr:hypothetical protein [Candidatus Eremiobacteraeota bacterium]